MRRTILIALACIVIAFITNHLAAYDKSKEKILHLDKITKIDGFYCIGWINTTIDGKLISFDSAAPIYLTRGIIPTGSRIVLHPNLNIQYVSLKKPTRIQGLLCVGYGPDSPAIQFFPDGNLKLCYLIEDTWINGILCHHGYFSRVLFSQNGKLLSCELAKDQKIDGKLIKARSLITLYENGKIKLIRKSNFFRSSVFDLLDLVL